MDNQSLCSIFMYFWSGCIGGHVAVIHLESGKIGGAPGEVFAICFHSAIVDWVQLQNFAK